MLSQKIQIFALQKIIFRLISLTFDMNVDSEDQILVIFKPSGSTPFKVNSTKIRSCLCCTVLQKCGHAK